MINHLWNSIICVCCFDVSLAKMKGLLSLWSGDISSSGEETAKYPVQTQSSPAISSIYQGLRSKCLKLYFVLAICFKWYNTNVQVTKWSSYSNRNRRLVESLSVLIVRQCWSKMYHGQIVFVLFCTIILFCKSLLVAHTWWHCALRCVLCTPYHTYMTFNVLLVFTQMRQYLSTLITR